MHENRMGIELAPSQKDRFAKKKAFSGPYFEKSRFGHLFLSIFKNFKKSGRKNSLKNGLRP